MTNICQVALTIYINFQTLNLAVDSIIGYLKNKRQSTGETTGVNWFKQHR